MGDWGGFFTDDEGDAEAERPRRYRRPASSGPPDGTAGTALALNLVLARNDLAAILLPAVEVFPAGLLVRLEVLTSESLGEVDPHMFGAYGGDASGRMRIGVKFADGRSASSGSTRSPEEHEPRLSLRSGGGGGGRSAQELWLWPLPPPGQLTFVAAWPDAGLEPAGTSMEAEPVLAAAAAAFVIFAEPAELPPSNDQGWTTSSP